MKKLTNVYMKDSVRVGAPTSESFNNLKYDILIMDDWKFIILIDLKDIERTEIYVPIENVKHFTFAPEEKKESGKAKK